MDPSDSALVLACRQGDSQAWQIIVQRYQRLIYTVARRAGLDNEAAADVFQQVFTVLVEHIHRLEQPERLKAWLVTTAQREAWRVRQRQPVALPVHRNDEHESETIDIADSTPLPEELLVQIEEQAHVHQAVNCLDDRCRELLMLLYYETTPPSYSEIARRLGTSEGSIGPTRARCLAKLRRLLGPA